MEVIIRQSEHKIDPKHPESSDPTYAGAVLKGRERLKNGELKFKSQAQERDYWKGVSSNPGNIPGMPNFFPPLTIKTSVRGVEVTDDDRHQVWLQKVKEMQRVTVDLGCTTCHSIQPHVISPWECFCQKCGTLKPYRTN